MDVLDAAVVGGMTDALAGTRPFGDLPAVVALYGEATEGLGRPDYGT